MSVFFNLLVLLLGTLAHIMSTLKLGTTVLIATKVSELFFFVLFFLKLANEKASCV